MPKRRHSIENSELGKIKVYEVYTPNERFSGFRESIRFVDGRAELPEPRLEDFLRPEDYEREHKAFEQKIFRFVKHYGYELATRTLEVHSISDRVDRETFDSKDLLNTINPGVRV